MVINKNMSSSKPPLHPSTFGSTPARPACAFCKYRRRRCPADCPLVPYFTAAMQREIDSVNRVFDIPYITQLLRTLRPHLRQDFIASVIYEANFRRATDPVYGCCAALIQLRRRLRSAEAEMQIVKQRLAFVRARCLHKITAFQKPRVLES